MDYRILKRPKKKATYLIDEDASATAHVYWTGSALADTKGNAWAMQGTVPQVAASGLIPAGAGPFSDSNYYKLGTGSDLFDSLATLCIVFSLPSNMASAPGLFDDESAGAGYLVQGSNPDVVNFWNVKAGASAQDWGLVAGLNVACMGRSGGNTLLKVNLRATITTAQAFQADATGVATLGRVAGQANRAWGGTIYEVYATSTTPTDTLFTTIANSVKTKAGITAW